MKQIKIFKNNSSFAKSKFVLQKQNKFKAYHKLNAKVPGCLRIACESEVRLHTNA